MSQPAKIIVADDDASFVKALVIRLEREGYEVLTATDGYFAVAEAVKSRPDLLILDVHMPAGSGFTVQERLEKVPELADVPVIYVTGDKSADVAAVARANAVAVIHKPFEVDDLLRAVESALAASAA